MYALLVLALIILIIVFAPPFKFSFSVNGKQFLIESSEISSSESD